MANTYLTSTLIAEEAVAHFEQLSSFIATGYKGDYAGMFNGSRYKAGNTVDMRLDNFFIGQRGDSVTAENIVESSIPLTILPLYSIPIAYTPTDLQRSIADWGDEVLKPAVRRIVAMMNTDIANGAVTQINNYVGDPTSYLNSFASINQANPVLDNLNANGYDRYMALSPKNMEQLMNANSLQNSFLPALNSDITIYANPKRLADFDLLKDNSITTHISGTHTTGSSITINTAVSSGTSISLAGTSSGGTYLAGDIFTIAGVYGYDRVNRQPLSTLYPFTVAANVTASGSPTTITVMESLVNSGPLQNFYVPGASPNQIPSGATVTFENNNFSTNVAYTERGLVVAIPPLQPMDSPESFVFTDSKWGVSMRVSKSAEVLDNQNIFRLDAQMAFAWVPNQAVKVLSQ